MRFNNLLEKVLGAKPKIKILRAMLTVKVPLTGRKIALLSGLNHRTCLLSLKDLAYEGLINFRSAGKSKIYTLNSENVFLKEVISKIFDKEENLLSSLFKRIRVCLNRKVLALILFGSVAEGKEYPDSDIDICVVLKSLAERKEVERIMEREREKIMSEYGNDLAPYYITRENFTKKYKKKDKLICDIAEKGKILMGERFF